MRRIGVLLAACALGVGPAAAGASAATTPVLPPAGDAWIRVETPHFVLFSDATVSKTKEIALDLERFRAVLLQLKPSKTENAPVPTTMFVFKSNAAMGPYKPRLDGKPRNVSGFFQPTSDGNYIALSAAWNKDPRRLIYHEYFHYFMRSNFAPQPLWYEEGAAEFYASFRSSGVEAEIGLPLEDHVRMLRDSKMLTLPELFAVRMDSPDYNEASKQGIFYAESWALVHYFLRGTPRHAPEFGRFLVQLQQGKNVDTAFREEFRMEPDEMLRELYGYIRQARFMYSRVRFEELTVPKDAAVTSIRWEDAVAALGDLMAHGGEDMLPDAEAHFQAVLGRVPAHAAALAGMGFCRYRADRFDEAAVFFQRAAEAGSTDFRVSYRLGELRLRALVWTGDSAKSESDAGRALEEVRAAFRRCLDLNPHFSEARAALGRTYLFGDAAHARDGIPILEAAVRELPARTDLALELAALYARAGDLARSEELSKRTLGPDAPSARPGNGGNGGSAADLLARVNLLLEQGKEDEAVRLFEEIVSKSGGEIREELQSQLTTLKKGVARNRAIRDYNEGLARWNRRDLEGALALFRKVAESEGDPATVKSARERIAELERAIASKKRAPKTSR